MKTPAGSVMLLAALMWLAMACGGVSLPDWFGEEEQATAVPPATRAPAAVATPVPSTTNLPAPSATPGSSNVGASSPGSTTPPLPTQVVPSVTVAIPDHVVAVVVPAQVLAVQIDIAESDPPQYFARVTSGLSSSCVEPHGYEMTYDGYSIEIKAYSREPGPAAQVVCATVYREHETSVPLGSDFESGREYTVTANGTTATFVAQ